MPGESPRPVGQVSGAPPQENPPEATLPQVVPADVEGDGEAGVDLARALLAQAKADARARERGPRSRGAAPRSRAALPRSSGAHPDDRDPQPLGRTARAVAAEHGWEEDLAVGGIVGRWPEIVGPEVAGHCVPEGWSDGVLIVRTDSTAWASQVRLLAPRLLQRLAEEVGSGVVRRVDVRGPGGPSWRRGPRSVKGRGPRDTYG